MGSRQSRRARNDAVANGVAAHQVHRDAVRLAMEQSLQDAPLPFGWDQAYTSKGVLYFIDHANKLTTWTDPRTIDLRRRGIKTNSKQKLKPPKYKWDFYAKVQQLRIRLRNLQNDDGNITIAVARNNLFDDSFALISNLDSLTLTRRLNIKFEGEDGLDYGGMSREWFLGLSEEMLSPKRNLFKSAGKYEYKINPRSSANEQHLELFYFVGIIMGMAIYHGKLFHSYFILPFYKQLLDIDLTLDDVLYYDEDIYKSLKYILEHDGIADLDLTFSMEMDDGKEVELIPKGKTTAVTDKNKEEYVKLCVQHYIGNCEKQMNAIKMGFKQFVPLADLKELFEPEEVAQLLGGSVDIDVSDLEKNTDYQGDYTESSQVIVWFWEALKGMSQEELRKFLHFVTGTHKVPPGGFEHLYGSSGPQKFTINKGKMSASGLPAAHSCFNRLDLPEYKDKNTLKKNLLLAVMETEGFGIE